MQDLPLGIIKSDITVDNNHIKLEYIHDKKTNKKYYEIHNNFEWYLRTNDLQLALLIFNELPLCHDEEIRLMIKYIKQENKRLLPFKSWLGGNNWDSLESRNKEIIYCAWQRLKGFKPVKCGKNSKWVKIEEV